VSFDYKSSYTLGHSYNVKIAQRLNDAGIRCYAPELRLAQNHSEIADFTANEQDVVLLDVNGWIEVKSSSFSFEDGQPETARTQMRNGSERTYDRLIVDTVSSFETKAVKPLAYVLISQKTDGVLVVPVTTKNNWTISHFFDYQRQHYDDFYQCPIQHLKTFDDLVAHLQSQSATLVQ